VTGSTMERLYRQIRALRICEDTTEIQKPITAKSLTESPKRENPQEERWSNT